MMKKKTGSYITKKFVLDYAWRFALSIILVLVLFHILHPERAMIKEYRKKLVNNHCVTKAYIYFDNPRDVKICYRFVVDGVKYSGISRYSHLNPPYPREGDSIEVYYSEKDPNINLWRGEFEK